MNGGGMSRGTGASAAESASGFDGAAYFRRCIAEARSGQNTSGKKCEAEVWYDSLHPTQKAVVDSGIAAITYGGCKLAVKRSHDTIRRQLKAQEEQKRATSGFGGEQRLASGLKFTPPPSAAGARRGTSARRCRRQTSGRPASSA